MNDKNKAVLEEKMGASKSAEDRRGKSFKGKRTRVKKDLKFQDDTRAGKVSCVFDGRKNDPKWYAASDQLLKDAFRMSTPYSLGSSFLTHDVDNQIPGTDSTTRIILPGIITMSLIPGPGKATDGSSAINIAADKMYQWIRHANAGATNYAAADAMTYLLAMDNCYMLWNWMRRLYGIMRTYNQTNLYMPQALAKSMNVDFDSFRRDLNSFRYLINQFGTQIGSYAVPAVMPYFTRHAWLFANIFADAPNSKAQLYVYNPDYLFFYMSKDETGSIPYLEPLPMGAKSTPITYDTLLEYTDLMVRGISDSTDMRTISGDILKAFGYNNLLTVEDVTENTLVLPAYSTEVLSQIENCVSNGDVKSTESLRIRQDSDEQIWFNPVFSTANTDNLAQASDLFLNFHKDDVTPEDVAVATRLMSVSTGPNVDYGNTQYQLYTFGSEICTGIYIWTQSTTDSSIVNKTRIRSRMVASTNSATGQSRQLHLSNLSQFHYHPLVAMYVERVDTSVTPNRNYKTFSTICGDTDNLTICTPDQLRRMHDVALMSLFDVPEVAYE